LEYPNGGTGYIYCCTTEEPGTNIMEFSGERGKLQVIGKQLRLWELPQGVKAYSDATDTMWGNPPSNEVPVDIPDCETGHHIILQNMARHILYGEALIAPGIEGLRTVELINAIILSGKTGQSVPVPVDRVRYDAFLQEMIRSSRPKETAGPDKRITDNVHI
jgi:predicted dehydrogenase